MKVRVCELVKGDRFIMGNVNYQVVGVENGKVYYMTTGINYKGRVVSDGYLQELGGRSQKFVNLVSHAPNTHYKKRVQTDPEIVGPGPSKKCSR